MNSSFSRRSLTIGALAVGSLTGGCYTFAPIQGAPPVGSEVRAIVTDEQALRLSDQTGRLARSYDGRLMGVSDDSVYVSVVSFRVASEFSGSRQLRQSLAIPRDGLDSFATRKLSVWRTGVLGAIAAGGTFLVVNQLIATGGDEGDEDDGEPIGTLVPIIRIPIGR